jgi:hypothetical protein
MAMYSSQPTAHPTENIGRGVVVALFIIPLGIVAWVIVWGFGIIASIVALGIAWGAVQLYRLGSGGFVTRPGAIAITLITIVTIGLSIFAGIVSDVANGLSQGMGIPVLDALMDPSFWPTFNRILADPAVQADIVPSILIAVAFSALGCFSILRGALRATAAQTPQQASPAVPYNPITPRHPDDSAS